MKIASSEIRMDAQHVSAQKQKIREFLVPMGEKNAQSAGLAVARASEVNISAEANSLQSNEANTVDDVLKNAENSPMLRLIRALVSMLTGEKTDICMMTPCTEDKASPAPQMTTGSAAPAPQAGSLFVHHETYSEYEETRFAASGVVQTSDGQQIGFNLSLHMERSYFEEVTIVAPQAARQTQDPLVLNFDGKAAQLVDQRFHFDLNADGVASEEINFLKSGSGFLVFDRNADGKVNDGSELFGVKSGDGFADLARLDDDKNGWIDENDSAWKNLKLWQKSADGKDQLASLTEAKVGALYLGRSKTPFALKNSDNIVLGQIRSSGVFLSETGQVGSIQQVDLSI